MYNVKQRFKKRFSYGMYNTWEYLTQAKNAQ
jgi:hypothetical protein